VAAVFEKVRSDPAYREQEAARFMPPKPDLDALATLPEGSLGRAYRAHIRANELDEQFYPDVEIVDDITYLSHRMMVAHDYWHVLTGFSTSVVDEIGLQAFTHAQTGTPFAASIVAAGLMHCASHRLQDLEPALAAITRGRELGLQARPLLSFPLEERLAAPLDQVRRELGLLPG
jgi:ubiquinone biosynthesis protein Coq4